MSDWAPAAIMITLILSILIYNIYSIKAAKDPKEELLRAKKLCDEGIIDTADFEKIKKRLVKKIISE